MLFVLLVASSLVQTAWTGGGDPMVPYGPYSGPTRAIGKVVDLNTTTQNPHADHLVRVGRVPGKYTDMFQFADIDSDSHLDMVFRQMNGTLTSNEDRTHILAVLGPLDHNASYTLSELPCFTLPYRIKSFIVDDIDGDGIADLVVSKKQYASADPSRNSSFIGYRGAGGSERVFPWRDPTFTVWLDPMENRTAENVSMLDLNGDSYRELLLQTRTWFRRRPQDYLAMPTNEYLVHDGTKTLLGRLLRTDVGMLLVGERQDTTVLGRYYLDHPLRSGNIVGGSEPELVSFERNFRPPAGGSLRGAVLVLKGPDLSTDRYFARGNVTTTISGVVYDGAVTRNSIGVELQDMDGDAFSDIMVTQQALQANLPNQFILVFKGNMTLPSEWDISLTGPSTTIEGFNPLLMDHDGDGKKDLVVGYYKETVMSRTSCGVLRVGLDMGGIQLPVTTSDLESMSVMGARSSDEIGRTIFPADLDGDARQELLALSGPQSMYIDLYVLSGLRLARPKVLEAVGVPPTCERGQALTVEVFARDPQNYPRYLRYDLEVRTGLDHWVAPKVTKTVQNFSYEAPYNGSTYLTFILPPELGTGKADLMVRATNTYGLVSDPYVMEDVTTVLNRFPSFVEATLSPKELYRGEELMLQGKVADPDDQGDLQGRALLKDGDRWYHICDLSFLSSGEFTGAFEVPQNATLGPNLLMMEVWDDNGAKNISAELRFTVAARPLQCSLSVVDRTVLRGDRIDALVSFEGELEPVYFDLELENGSNKVSKGMEVGLGGSAVNMTVPLNLSVGLYTLSLFASDGVWTASSTLDGQVEVRNNLPSMVEPLSFSLSGLSGELDLRGKAFDREDGTDLEWSLKGAMEAGMSAYLKDPSGIIYVDLSDNRTRSLTVAATDSDGGSVEAALEVRSNWKAPPLGITVRVMGLRGQLLEGSNVTLDLVGVQVAAGTTGTNGMTDLFVPQPGTYSIRVVPRADIGYIDALRSGYLPYEGKLEVEPQTLLYDIVLTYKEVEVVKLSVLSVSVKDRKGLPVEGANVSLSGPVELTLQTDPSGSATFKDLMPGSYVVMAFKDGVASDERSIAVGQGQYLTEEIVLDIGHEERQDDEAPIIPLIGGSLLVGILLGLLFLFLIGAFGKGNGPSEE